MIHFPENENEIKQARRRLIYEELLILQLGILSAGSKEEEKTEFVIKEDFSEEFISRLPFSPTNAQRRAINECIRDMKMHSPMRRLLQGDVGSGKTAVCLDLGSGSGILSITGLRLGAATAVGIDIDPKADKQTVFFISKQIAIIR